MIMSVHEPRGSNNTEAPAEMSMSEKLQMYHDQGYFPSLTFLKKSSLVSQQTTSMDATEASESLAGVTFDKDAFFKSDFLTQADMLDIPVE